MKYLFINIDRSLYCFFFSNNKNRNKYSNLWSDLHIKMKDVGFKYWFIEKCNNTNFTHFIGMLLYKICQTIK